MVFPNKLRVGSRVVSFRPEEPADRGLLQRIYASARQEEMEATGWTPEQKEMFLRMQFNAQDGFYRQNFPGHAFFVIVVDEVDAGRLYLDETPSEIRIMDITLLPNFRRAGLGREIVALVTAEAGRRGVIATLHVEDFNPAMRLYLRLGFLPGGSDGVYTAMEWRGTQPPGGQASS